MPNTGTSQPLCELPVSLVLTDADRDDLRARFLRLTASPYLEYAAFMEEVELIVRDGDVPPALLDLVAIVSATDQRADPFALVTNCPIDTGVPVFDYDEPVDDKRRVKTTFVAEAFLALWAILRRTPPIGYLNVNDGDVFQDIFPKRSMRDSQSQKALGKIHFHKDLANHFVRPDYVNMICLRSDNRNEIYTSFVRNREALDRLDDETVEQLREAQFHTPYDDLTVAGGKVPLGEADAHAILSGELDLRFFESRTQGATPAGQAAVEELIRTLHALKARVLLQPGDFLSEHNNFSMHCKEVVRVDDPEAQRARWMIKTVNVDRLADHEQHFVEGRRGIVAG